MDKSKIKKLAESLKNFQSNLPLDTEMRSVADSLLKDEFNKLSEKVRGDSVVKYLDRINEQIAKFKKEYSLDGINSSLSELQEEINEAKKAIVDSVAVGEKRAKELSDLISQTREELETSSSKEVASLLEKIDGLEVGLSYQNKTSEDHGKSLGEAMKSFEVKLGDILKKVDEEGKGRGVLSTSVDTRFNESSQSAKKTLETIEELRKDLMTRINNIQGRGGNANRNIAIGGNTSVLSRYTDINIKPGANVTLTYSNNNTTKYLDLTIASSGGGGSVGGVVRSINTITTSQTAGSNTGTDYVYVCSQGVALTLPTAASNTNLYTVKNTSNSSVVVLPDGAETIDDQSNAILTIKYTSVDLISDGSNWKIT